MYTIFRGKETLQYIDISAVSDTPKKKSDFFVLGLTGLT